MSTTINLWQDPHFQLAAEHFGYVPNAPLALRDREVIALADFLRSKHPAALSEGSDSGETLQRHHCLAADARKLLHNGGAGPNASQLRRVDKILREIAGLPADA